MPRLDKSSRNAKRSVVEQVSEAQSGELQIAETPTPIPAPSQPLEPQPSPAPVPAAPPSEEEVSALFRIDKDDDASPALIEARESLSGDSAIAEVFGDEPFKESGPKPAPSILATPEEAKAALAKSEKEGSALSSTFSVAKDIGRGVTEFPKQFLVAGPRDAIQEVINLVDDVNQWATNNPNAVKIAPQLPEVKEPESTTGKFLRSASQFLTGFVGAGKFIKGGGLIKAGIKGAIADFAVFDGHEKRLSNLIEEVPALKNPVNEFLAADPSDSKLEGRFKNAVDGVLGGMVVDGLTSAVKAIRASRIVRAEARTIEETIAKEAPFQFEQLGKVDDEALIAKREKPLMAKGPDVEPKDIGTGGGETEFFINFAKIKAPEDIQKVMGQMADLNAKGIKKESRGVRTWKETKVSADQEDAWKVLQERRQGEPLNAEQSVAARQLWVSSANKLTELANLAAREPSEANLFQFRKMLATHYGIQKEVLAARTETARALNAWKIPVGSQKEQLLQLQAMLEASGGKEVTQLLAEKVSKLSQAGLASGVETMVNGSVLAKSKDAVLQLWINSLLSNPATHVVNSVSNFSVLAQQITERKAAGYISQFFGTDGGVELSEAAAMVSGVVSSFKDALRASVKTLKKDTSELGALGFKVEQRPGAFSPEVWEMANDSLLGRGLGVVDAATNAPGRLLGASDEFFKTLGYRAELHAQATRLASQELRGGKFKPEMLKSRIQEIIDNPPDTVRLESVGAALYSTFTNKPNQTLNRLASGFQNLPVIGRLFMPFKNTPINIMTYSFERSPLAPLMSQWRSDIAAGGAKADLAMARTATGTLVMLTAMDMALSGTVTGKGPREKNQRDNWLRQGNQEYSVKVGDKWVSYRRLDPIGMTLGLAADFVEASVNAQDDIKQEDFEKAFIGALFAVSNNVLSKTYMSGMADLIDAVTNPKIKGERLAMRLSGSVVPAGVAASARAMDPYMRTASDMMEAIQRRTPGLSDELPLYKDLWGREVSYRSGAGWAADMVNPFYIKTHNPEPIDTELQRLEYYPGMPDKKMSFTSLYSAKSMVLELEPKQYQRFVELSGNELKHPAYGSGAKDFLNKLVTNKSEFSRIYNLYSDGPDGGKAQFIRKIMNEYRELAKRKLLEEDKRLRSRIDIEGKMAGGKFDPEVFGGGF